MNARWGLWFNEWCDNTLSHSGTSLAMVRWLPIPRSPRREVSMSGTEYEKRRYDAEVRLGALRPVMISFSGQILP